MDFEFNDVQRKIAALAEEIARNFPPEYWREKDKRGEFAKDFWEELIKANLTGIMVPEKYGGMGLGITEFAIAAEELAMNGCEMAGYLYLLTEIFIGVPLIRYGTVEQKERYLPRIVRGEKGCLALTEPHSGSNIFAINTTAIKEGDEWIINGSKIFITGADMAKFMIIVARTPISEHEEMSGKRAGLSLFIAELPNKAINISPIPKYGVGYINVCTVRLNNLRLSNDLLIGTPGQGWHLLLDVLNAERIGGTASVIGLGKLAISKAVEYSKRRKVFKDPIGSYQSLQFPLAEAYASLECARLMNFKASTLWDKKASPSEVGKHVNIAKVVAAEAATKAVFGAMQVFGAYAYGAGSHFERWMKEVSIFRIAPITQQLALAYIGEHILKMPKSYRA